MKTEIWSFSGRTVLLAAIGMLVTSTALAGASLAENAEVSASSERGDYLASKVADGVVSDQSRWLADEGDDSPWVKIDFDPAVTVGAVDVFSGWGSEAGLSDFDVEVEAGGRWLRPTGGRVRGNKDNARRLKISQSGVTSLRLSLAKQNPGRIREIAVYEDPETMVTAGLEGGKLPLPKVDRTIHQIALNQVGYLNARPKRFTAPLSADGTHFGLREADGEEILFRGKIDGGVGDFSEFTDGKSGTRYVIEVRGGSLKGGVSDPFLVSDELYAEQFLQPAVDFLNDSRSVVGTHPSAYGGCPWRDGTYYDAMIPSLVLFYLADKDRIDAMPRQMDWAAEKARVTSADFKFDAKNPGSEGVMDAVKNYYALEPPNSDAPDVVKLIHWGAGYYLVNPATKDPSGDPLGRRVHSQTIEQVSYVLWAWPVLKEWLPQSFHDEIRDLCFEHWEKMGALGIPKLWNMQSYQKDVGGKAKNPMGGSLHPYKGRHAPGHSIVPNLIMHEVAKREGRDDADVYLKAAVEQAEWIVKELDWQDPRSTKGHRMSEHRTISNLVWMLQRYPDDSPPGLKAKITEWAEIAVARSENLWDFRRYDLDDHWTIPKLNDVGNILSLPAIALSASWVVDDPKLKARLEELAVAAVDQVFGRNPRLAAAPSQPKKGFPEVERGWPKEHPHNVCARLELCRGSISASPGSEMYPFNPEGRFRHAEGWVNYGASWWLSLAYFCFDEETKITPDP